MDVHYKRNTAHAKAQRRKALPRFERFPWRLCAFAVLEALLHKGPLPINEIGRKVLLTSGSITVAVDRLESKGLVERRASGTDRRAKIVYLTKAGNELITRVYNDHAADMERLASASLTRAERETLMRLLKKIGYQAAAKSLERSS